MVTWYVKDEKVMLPLCEAKMFHHYDHRFGTYAGQTEAQARQGKAARAWRYAHQNPNAFVVLSRYWVAEA